MILVQRDNDNDESTFWRKLILPEEDRRRLFPDMTWKGGYRWFRSENVVCIEHFRRPHLPGRKAGRFGWIKR